MAMLEAPENCATTFTNLHLANQLLREHLDEYRYFLNQASLRGMHTRDVAYASVGRACLDQANMLFMRAVTKGLRTAEARTSASPSTCSDPRTYSSGVL